MTRDKSYCLTYGTALRWADGPNAMKWGEHNWQNAMALKAPGTWEMKETSKIEASLIFFHS